MATTNLRLEVPALWDLVRGVRDSVGKSLREIDPDVRDAAVMAASELVENAIKYGFAVKGHESSVLEVACDDEQLSITMSSGISNFESARETIDRVKFIEAAEDKHALYIARLRELLTQQSGRSQLGLYRIASEGAFHLDARLEGHVLRVTASRGLA